MVSSSSSIGIRARLWGEDKRYSFLTHWRRPRESIRGSVHGQGMQQQEVWAEHVWHAQHTRGGNKLSGRPGDRSHMEIGRGWLTGTNRELHLFSGTGIILAVDRVVDHTWSWSITQSTWLQILATLSWFQSYVLMRISYPIWFPSIGSLLWLYKVVFCTLICIDFESIDWIVLRVLGLVYLWELYN